MRKIPLVPAPPENPGVEALYKVMESLTKMSNDEMFALSVRAGIHRPDGRLTPEYGGEPDEKPATAA
jgi:hypothetical protein